VLPHPERLAEAYRRRVQPETRATRPPLAPMEDQSSTGRQGVARLLDREAASLRDQAACAPRMTRLRQRLARLEEPRPAVAEAAALHGEWPLISGRLEDCATTRHDGLETADWASKRDLIRALGQRVDVTRHEGNVVCRIDPYPRANDPEKKVCNFVGGEPQLPCATPSSLTVSSPAASTPALHLRFTYRRQRSSWIVSRSMASRRPCSIVPK
jgi:hypothetical protein